MLPKRPAIRSLQKIAEDYKAILLSTMQMIADRYEQNQDYFWIDTKIHTATGQSFDEDLIRGKDVIYTWIQGRGLEALANHIQWIERNYEDFETRQLAKRLKNILKEVLANLASVRRRNCGRLFFFITPSGEPFVIDQVGKKQPIKLTSQSPYNFSDIFCSKGMYATAQYLGDKKMISEAERYCLEIRKAVWNGNFACDQQQLDPENPIKDFKGRYSHGAFMLQIGTAALLARYKKDDSSVEMGLRLIEYILNHHINCGGRWPELEDYDFVEFIDDDNNPYIHKDSILSDPGHALEFVGLALKLTDIVRNLSLRLDRFQERINKIELVMPEILKQNFKNGFNYETGGICKLLELKTRTAVHSDMAWWSLPETIRAAMFCWNIADSLKDKNACLEIISLCHNAFVTYYIRRNKYLTQIQNRTSNGDISKGIPATADADPGYHTGLSLMDFLEVLSRYSD